MEFATALNVRSQEGTKCWEGTNNEILKSKNENLNDFIFASTFAKKIREMNEGG